MVTLGKYILDGHTPIPCDDFFAWAEWFEKADRRVAHTVIGEVEISTVFLAMDHSFFNHSPPLLFETMIFGGVNDSAQWRYSTWEEAEAGHREAVALVLLPPEEGEL